MTLPLWAGFAIFGAAAVFAVALFPIGMLWAEYLKRRAQRRKDFPQTVPGFKTRMARCPFPPQVVADMLGDLELEWTRSTNHGRRPVHRKLGVLNLLWLKVAGERAFVDELGRRIAGDHQGDDVRIAYLVNDAIGHTAAVHECGHELCELDGSSDGKHTRAEVWGPDGLVLRVKKAHSA